MQMYYLKTHDNFWCVFETRAQITKTVFGL